MNNNNININKFIHSKMFMIVMILVLIGLVGGVGTYAWFTWSSTNNTSLTLSIGKIADVTFDTGNDINTNNLAPVFNYTDGEITTFSITNKDTSGTTVSYSVKLNITNISPELANDSLKYKLISNGEEVGSGDFSSASSGGSITLGTGSLSSKVTDFVFYLYIDGNIENNPNMMNKNLSGTITVDVVEGTFSSNTLAKLGLSVDTEHIPDFTTVSGNSGIKIDMNTGNELATGLGDLTNGIYEAEDDLGRSYYFRGNVQNNYVYFAKNWWRIVRINGDGSIRMIFDTINDYGCPYIYVSMYNFNYNDNAYVGYMYGTAGSTSYSITHANINDNTIKTCIDDWYQESLSSYSQYIADAIYCNDREVVNASLSNGNETITFSGNGSGVQNSAYAGMKRTYIDHTPTLKCTNKNDRFTVNSSLGNGDLTYPIGLITTDEIVMAGGSGVDYATNSAIFNENYYLYVYHGMYWSMTPFAFFATDREKARVGSIGSSAAIDNYVNNTGLGVRPVVSLKSNAITGGTGTSNDPFIVNEAPDSTYKTGVCHVLQ